MKISWFNIINHQRKRNATTALAVRDQVPPNNVALVVADQNLDVTTINENQLVLRAKGGRPKGATVEKKRDLSSARIAARNEICTLYHKEKKQNSQAKKRMRKGRLDEIIKSVKV